MTDQELDRALTAALDVDHSPDFLARVRTRIAAERVPRRSHLPWRFAVAGAAFSTAVVAAIIVSWPAVPRPRPESPLVTGSPNGHVSAMTLPPAIESSRVTANASSANIAKTRPRATAVRSLQEARFPEVLISPEDARGIELLLMRAREGRIPAVLPTDHLSAREALSHPQIDIPLLAIEPLPQIAPLEEGDRPQ